MYIIKVMCVFHREEILSCLQAKLADVTTHCRVMLRTEQLEKVYLCYRDYSILEITIVQWCSYSE